MGREPKLLSAPRQHPAPRRTRVALAARRQDQIRAPAVRQHRLRLAGRSDRVDLRNPDADSWVADFLAWWIDPETGLPISERAGMLRYYIRVAGKIEWADRPEELMQHLPRPQELPPGFELPRPISVTFIPAKVFDNPALLRVNPDYLAWLLALPLLECERLLGGNWKIWPAAGLYFKREWCAVVDEVPAEFDHIVRYWDLAATEKTEFNDPDSTVGRHDCRSRGRPRPDLSPSPRPECRRSARLGNGHTSAESGD